MSQASITLPTSGTLDGVTLARSINAGMAALGSDFAGATDPTTITGANIQACSKWADTGNMLLKRRSTDNSQWITIGVLDSAYQGLLARSGGSMTGAINEALAPAVASAATPDIWSGAGNTVHITGTTAITGFAAAPQAGARRTIVFDGSLTLTAGANLILPGSANIQTAAGDCCVVLAETATRFRVVSYTRADGTALAQAGQQLPSVTAVVASGALTVGLNPITLAFRNASTASGSPSTVSIGSALSLTVPSGATLGMTNGAAARLAVLALNNGGTVSLGIVNITGASINLDESGVVSTIAISSSAANVGSVYSATALSNVPYRVVEFIDITEDTAGAWVTAPTSVIGVGGMTGASLASIGVGQTPQNMTSNRVSGATYYNADSRPRKIEITLNFLASGSATFYRNGMAVQQFGPIYSDTMSLCTDVGPLESYSCKMSGVASYKWVETK